MLRNYLKIAWRNLVRNRAFSAINIVGLAIGVAACVLILQYVAFELSYDNFHAKGDRIYRVRQDRYNEGKLSTQWAAGAQAAGYSFKGAFPEVEDYVNVLRRGSAVVDYQEKRLKVEKVYIASQSFFTVFSYPLLAGNSATALAEPNTVVLSQTVARRLFGRENPLGKTIQQNRQEAVKVTAFSRTFRPIRTCSPIILFHTPRLLVRQVPTIIRTRPGSGTERCLTSCFAPALIPGRSKPNFRPWSINWRAPNIRNTGRLRCICSSPCGISICTPIS
ncbi:ABC transporter permease [Spirosoma endophyticum]|uniref:MacB-like core domain-containing protein n=1 Tax=Spirosoma endophyticum TaxID=662367 RepID=A0A1I2FQE8_9BACT|nr:ABC transporter permease [Spirosoma endophyticum]SFF06810.1 MacB-like core domain-containing protein [Spirosoma endophyticum]